MMQNLIIYGIGEFAEYIRYSFENDSNYNVVAFCLESSYLSQISNLKNKIADFNKLKDTHPPESYHLFIAVGNDSVRERIYNEAIGFGYKLASFISSKATYYKNIQIGQNTFISEDSAIQPFVKIGNNSFIIGARIGHHSVIGNNVLLSLSFIGSNSNIGNNSFLGLNSAIKPNTVIGKRNIIGMGCNVTNSTDDDAVYTATPAKKRSVSYKDIGNKYL